jgi:hypothetical protein
MATVLKECVTEEQRSVVGTKGHNEKDVHKKYFSFLMGRVSRLVANIFLMTKMLKRRCGSG